MPDADPPRPARRAFLRGCIVAAVVVAGYEGWDILFGDNIRIVIPHRAYRSATVAPKRLARLIRDKGIRTVINLRGVGTDPWYLGETRTTAACGISQEDVCLSALRLPAPPEIRQLIDVIEHTEYPVLIHCQRGVDRTGLVSAMVLLLTTDADLSMARRELALYHGHVALLGTENMEAFLDLYEGWLTNRQIEHTPALFKYWAVNEYCPGPCRGRIEPLDPLVAPPAGTVTALHVRAHNDSSQTWQLRAGTQEGIHVKYAVYYDVGPMPVPQYAGLYRAEVPPGQSIDLTLVVPPLKPGHYVFLAELVNGRECSFRHMGGEPLFWEMNVRE